MARFRKALLSLGAVSRKSATRDPEASERFLSSLPSLNDELSFLRSRPERRATQNATALSDPLPALPALPALPKGSVESTPYGSHYVVREAFPDDHFHGKVRLGRFSSANLERLMALMQETPCGSTHEQVVFLDTETTGMQGGTGMCPFLVGVGYFEGDEFQMVQYFIRDFDEEPAMLHSLGEFLKRFRLVITYNGAAFDVPLLETRFTLARQENPFAGLAHFDMLFPARRLWRNGHGSCRLAALERELLSFVRGNDDVPGAMIPRVYFDYLQRQYSRALNGVFKHNVHDVVSLAALTIHACDRVTSEPAPLDEPLDLYSLAHLLDDSSEWRRSIDLYEMAQAGDLPEPFRSKTLETLCVLYRRNGDLDRSYSMCTQLMAAEEFSLIGYEGAAIYFERSKGDPESALCVLEEGLRRLEHDAGRKRPRIILHARWQRLQQRVLKGIL